uniref:Uncharacterized protein n=1 Tax=Octopus bimaculoides TaxID=37653 RepID=A0A0L8I3L8_OCTBM
MKGFLITKCNEKKIKCRIFHRKKHPPFFFFISSFLLLMTSNNVTIFTFQQRSKTQIQPKLNHYFFFSFSTYQ